MADPLSVSASIIALVTFAFTSSASLYSTVRDFRSQDKRARELKSELGDLTGVLQSLLETVSNNPDIDFEALKPPLHRCGNACNEYGDLIARVTKNSTPSRPSVRQWFTEKYLQGDISDFKAMLAAYKSTINIALANANLRVAAVTPRVLEDYKDMISDTNHDLGEHLKSIDIKIQKLAAGAARDPDNGGVDWEAMLEEKKSTQQGLKICAQLSAQIEQLEPTPTESSQFSASPSAHKYMRSGLNATRSTVRTLVTQLRNHEDEINIRMDAMTSTALLSDEASADLARLQDTKESIRQCIHVVSEADDTLIAQRQNLFEDITLSDEALNFTISTVGDLVTARRITLTGRSLNVGGQISDESYQKSFEAIARLDRSAVRPLVRNTDTDQSASSEHGRRGGSKFDGRHGHGVRLSHAAEDAKQRQDT